MKLQQLGNLVFTKVNMTIAKRNVVHSNHIFATTMRLMSKPTYFMTSNVLVLHVHVVATCYNRICNYKKG
jgi:hypothetical protein